MERRKQEGGQTSSDAAHSSNKATTATLLLSQGMTSTGGLLHMLPPQWLFTLHATHSVQHDPIDSCLLIPYNGFSAQPRSHGLMVQCCHGHLQVTFVKKIRNFHFFQLEWDASRLIKN